MNTQTPWHLPLALSAAALLLPLSAHAAPKLDPRLIGHWQGPLVPSAKTSPLMDMTFRANATETMLLTAPKQRFVGQATYTAASGTLTMHALSATDNGKTITPHHTQVLKYKITGPTLTLDDGTPTGHVVLHRIGG